MRPGGSGINRITLKEVTLFPEPDSPTIPKVFPRSTEKLISCTA